MDIVQRLPPPLARHVVAVLAAMGHILPTPRLGVEGAGPVVAAVVLGVAQAGPAEAQGQAGRKLVR